ncbi:ABC transporter permease [Paracoccus aminophilus]|uniref:ABC-type nitrate/sulfonate/bicarbonate transport system, permease component n=1 Tax=Paracoccus aminophilus JCM 7686 TaxID=1367847 RepID=S5XUL9_PARAH|nr:ABC transporter permease [Paracoccus aminophilus]AGT11194.1 ABC-type nitrate/sulfonate/bicarbonate transport system, permease component [Paracoccus aminophilus JCM 7686]
MSLIAQTGQASGGWTARMPSRLRGTFRALPLAALAPVGLLVLWQGAASSGLVAPQILPAPARVIQTFIELARDGELTAAIRISAWRLAIGLVVGGALGFLFGILLGASRQAEEWLGPSFRAIAAVPALGWIPVLILLVGIDEMLKIIILTKACFVPMTIATRDAWRAVPREFAELGDVLGLSARARFLRIRLPAMVPMVFGGLRLASGQAFVSLVTCEMLAATEGIGYLMIWGRSLFQMDMVLVGMIVVGVSGVALDQLLRLTERALRARMGEDV